MTASFSSYKYIIRLAGFLGIIFLININVYAHKIDSDVEKEINFSKKALTLNKLKLATKYAANSYLLAQEEDDITLAIASNYYAYILNLDSLADKAEVYKLYFNAYLLMIINDEDVFENRQKVIINSILGIANLYYDKGLKSKALNIFHKLPKEYSPDIDTSYIIIKRKIIDCYFNIEDYKSIISVSKELISNNLDVEHNYSNVSDAYSKIGDYKGAISNEKLLLSILSNKDSCKVLFSKKRIASWYYMINDNSNAIKEYEGVLRASESCSNSDLQDTKLRLANCYTSVLDFKKSEKLIKEITKNAKIKSASDIEIKAINKFIILAFYQKDYQRALHRLKMYVSDFDNIKNIPLRIQLYTTAITVYESVEDYKSAYKVSKKLKNLNAIVLLNKNAELELLIKKQRAESLFGNLIFEKSIKSELYRRDAEAKRIFGLNQKVMSRNRILLDGYLVMIGLIVIAIVILIIVLKYHLERKKLTIELKKSNKDIALALKKSIEQKQTLKELNTALLESNMIVKSSNEILERKTQEINVKNNELEKALAQIHEMQDQLIESQRLASLGQVTAGIAHEIRNPLNFVLNFSSLIIDFLKEAEEIITDELKLPDSEEKKNLDEVLSIVVENTNKIIKHGNRASKIITDMLNVSRKGSNIYEDTNINELIRNSAELAIEGEKAGITGFNVDVEYDFDETINDIAVIKQDFGRVIINLIGNACQAIEPKVKQDHSFIGKIVISSICKADNLYISIKDNGIGIDEEVKEMIFTPFFTTKPAGKGTGLGLTMTYDIITKLHKGTVNVESEQGEFTIINIRIPNNLK